MLTDKNIPALNLTCLAPINIAVIKYWGKRDEKLNLPLHSSLSVTLSFEELSSKTTISTSSELEDDELWLNGEKADSVPPRLRRVIDEVRRQCYKRRREESDKFWVAGVKLKICSENNFPTAAGLASSASGYAAVAYGLCKLFDLKGDVSLIARLGSGSACRSTVGGFVRWDKGECTYGADSLARQIASEDHWPDLHVLILVVNDQRKEVGSTDGMERSQKTSDFLQYRADFIIPDRIKKMEKAILDRDFDAFAELTMKDSNQFHAVCQDTYPPIEPPYLTPVSHDIIQLITELNQVSGQNIAAYTFDAGPNAFVFTLTEHLPSVIATISAVFFPSDGAINRCLKESGYFRGLPLLNDETLAVNAVTTKIAARRKSRGAVDSVKYIIHTKPGSGPKVVKQLP